MIDLTWVEPRWFWALALVPVAGALKAWELARRRRALQTFGDRELLRRLNPDLEAGPGPVWRTAAFTLALALLVLTSARPAGRPEAVQETLKRTGIDIMLAVDLSASMKATDLAPSRMQAAKTALKTFLGRVENDPVGLTVFAGSVSLQCPLTLDLRTVQMMVDIINTDFLPVDGTALGDALAFALDKIGAAERKGSVIVLMTDGENTRGGPPLEAAKKAKEAGARVYTIGIGTAGGAQIPDGVDAQGRPKVKMYQGEPVVTKLDEEVLKQIAAETGGKYFYASTAQALLDAYAEIDRLTKTAHEEKKTRYRYQERYLWVLVPALLLLLFETLAAAGWPAFGRRRREAGRA